jgi:hypothetical protein
MFRLMSLFVAMLVTSSVWAQNSCDSSECRYPLTLGSAGIYKAIVTLPPGSQLEDEGLWSLVINPSEPYPRYLNGFWAGSLLQKSPDGVALPSWVGFSLLQRESIDITPYEWNGGRTSLPVKLYQDKGYGLFELDDLGEINPVQTRPIGPLNPGFYVIGSYSQAGSPIYRGWAVQGQSLLGGVVGGYIDSSSSQCINYGYAYFIVNSPTNVELLLLFGDSYQGVGSSQPHIEITYQPFRGQEATYWSAPLNIDQPYTCGPQPNNTPVNLVSQCDALVEQGGDAPEIHSIDLGKTAGTFQFQYDTVSIMDRILIEYEGQTLFDSGCIGTNGDLFENIVYSGNSTNITVRVLPNCAGTSGTYWSFQVGCPN